MPPNCFPGVRLEEDFVRAAIGAPAAPSLHVSVVLPQAGLDFAEQQLLAARARRECRGGQPEQTDDGPAGRQRLDDAPGLSMPDDRLTEPLFESRPDYYLSSQPIGCIDMDIEKKIRAGAPGTAFHRHRDSATTITHG